MATPRKWPGRERPSSSSASGPGSTRRGEAVRVDRSRRPARRRRRRPRRRRWRRRPPRRADSGRSPRPGPNCAGLTKRDMTTVAAERRAARSRARWPSCSAPIVGTSATSSRPASAAASSGSVRATAARVRDGEWIGICESVPLRWMESVAAFSHRSRCSERTPRDTIRACRSTSTHAARASIASRSSSRATARSSPVRSAPPARSRSCSRRSRRARSAATSRRCARRGRRRRRLLRRRLRLPPLRNRPDPRSRQPSGPAARTARSRPRAPLVVAGEGPMPAELMLVADAPGFHDDRLGRPLVAAAGELLAELLASIGLERREVYVTTLVKCRPPGTQSPAAEEIAACRDKLERQVELVRPRVVAAVGDLATRALAGGGARRLADARAGAPGRHRGPRGHAAPALPSRRGTAQRAPSARARGRCPAPRRAARPRCRRARARSRPRARARRTDAADEQQLGLF